MFPSAFPGETPEMQVFSTNSAFILAIVMLGLSYLMSLVLALCAKSWIFCFEIIYLPHLWMSILGLLNVIANLGIYNFVDINTHIVVSLVVGMLSILVYTFAALIVFRKIHITRKRDGLRRETRSSVKTFTMPETELQRQQLLRLLLSQEDNAEADSPDRGPEATYKIQWPGLSASQTRRNTMSTLRHNMPFSHNRFGSRLNSTQHHHQRSLSGGNSSVRHQLPAEPHHGAIERGVPDMIVEEPTMTSNSPNHSELGPGSLHPNMHNPLLPAFFDHHPGERIPSYPKRSSSHYTQGTGRQGTLTTVGASSPNPPVLGLNGYPLEKPEAYKQMKPSESPNQGTLRPLDNYTVVDDEEELRVRMQSFSNHDRNGKRPEYELEDRGQRGTRLRPELHGDNYGKF